MATLIIGPRSPPPRWRRGVQQSARVPPQLLPSKTTIPTSLNQAAAATAAARVPSTNEAKKEKPDFNTVN